LGKTGKRMSDLLWLMEGLEGALCVYGFALARDCEQAENMVRTTVDKKAKVRLMDLLPRAGF
jgi:hypothetical protein